MSILCKLKIHDWSMWSIAEKTIYGFIQLRCCKDCGKLEFRIEKNNSGVARWKMNGNK